MAHEEAVSVEGILKNPTFSGAEAADAFRVFHRARGFAGHRPNVWLGIACKANRIETVEYMLAHYAPSEVVMFDYMIEAARNHFNDLANYLLRHGAPPQRKIIAGRTASVLVVAIEDDNRELLHFALDADADVNTKVVTKANRPLHVAIWMNNAYAFNELVNHRDVLVDSIDYKRRTPLNLAAALGNMSFVEALLSKRAIPAMVDVDGNNMLHSAAFNSHLDIVELVLQGNLLDVGVANKAGETAMHMAAARGDSRMAALLRRFRGDPNQRTLQGESSFFIAAKSSNVQMYNALMAGGVPNYDLPDINKETALHRACRFGKFDMVDALLASGVLPDAPSAGGERAVHAAAGLNRPDIIVLLRAKGASLDVTDDRSRTALVIAVARGFYEAARALCTEGADVNVVVTEGGATALTLAAAENRTEYIKLLSDFGADLDHEDAVRGSALDHALFCGNHAAVRLLIGAGAALQDRHRGKMIKDDAGQDVLIENYVPPQPQNQPQQ